MCRNCGFRVVREEMRPADPAGSFAAEGEHHMERRARRPMPAVYGPRRNHSATAWKRSMGTDRPSAKAHRTTFERRIRGV